MRTVTVVPLALLLCVAFLTGCSPSRTGANGDASAIAPTMTYADLPEQIGRGYPVVQVDPKAAGVESAAVVGAVAPDFSMQLADGGTIRLSDLRGRPVMLNFWATWCMPCRIEMPDIVREANLDDDLVVIAANVQEDIDAIRPFAEDFGMSMPIALDADGKLRDLYQVRGMPTSYFIDRNGDIASIWAGPLLGDQLRERLDGIR